MCSLPQINYVEILTIVGISIVSTILFDLPFQEISKIITRHTGSSSEIKPTEEESPKEDSEDVLDTDEKNVDQEIDEIWNNESHPTRVSFADNDVMEEEEYSKRSFTPVWKKSDDEKPVWGDDDDEESVEDAE